MGLFICLTLTSYLMFTDIAINLLIFNILSF